LTDSGRSGARSEKIGLAHDSHEFILTNLAISITVSLFDHLLNLVVCHVLAQLLSDTLQVAERDLACLIIVEESESFEHFFSGVSFSHLLGHHVQEFIVIDHTGAIRVHICNHLLDLFTFWLKAKCAHCDLELLLVDIARTVRIEKIKSFLDLLLLFLSDVTSFLGSLESLLLVRCLNQIA
jgi:hypothetical protein